MSKSPENRRHAVALFRYGVIADVLHLPRGSTEIATRLREKAQRTHDIPHSKSCRVAAETMRHWLKLYRKSGFDALMPQARADRGNSHALPTPVVDLIRHTKEEHRDWSVTLIIKHVRSTGIAPADLPLPPSTVHRLLARAGLMRKDDKPTQDHRRFAFEHANELWMSDVMHGPTVGVGGKVRRKAYLIAFIDDATRVVPHAAFALSENTAAFLPQLQQAIMRRGIPKRLFVDNGSAFRSQHLQLVCAKLGITLIHARAYHPEAKGKQERWFRTVRMQLLPTLSAEDTASLANLNSRLWAWIEGEYHRTPHKGLDMRTPLDAWAEHATHVQHVGGRADLPDMFLFEERRKVAKDRTVSLQGTHYEVEAHLVGTTVLLRYDPDRLNSVQVWDSNNVRHSDAKPVDVYANRLVKRDRPETKDDAGKNAHAATIRFADFLATAKKKEEEG